MATLDPRDTLLKKHGLGGIADPALVEHMAQLVRDHEHFRQFLFSVEPQHRTEAYDAMRPHLIFKAKSLFDYTADARTEAAEKIRDKDQIRLVAEEAIRKNLRETEAKGKLTLLCSKCTVEEVIPAKDRILALKLATDRGWLFDTLEGGKEVMVCPDCPGVRSNLMLQ